MHTKFPAFKCLLLKTTAFLPNTLIRNSSLNRQTNLAQIYLTMAMAMVPFSDEEVGIYFLDYMSSRKG